MATPLKLVETITKTNGKISYSSSFAPINLTVFDYRTQLDEMAEKHPDKVAFIFQMNNDMQMTYSQLRDRAYALARNFMSLGLKHKNRIGFLFPNTYEIVICYYAAILAGLTSVPLDVFYGAKQIEFMMKNTEASAFVIWNSGEYKSVIDELLPELKSSSSTGDVKFAKFPHLRRVIMAGNEYKTTSEVPNGHSFYELESKRIDQIDHEFPTIDPHDIFAILSTVLFFSFLG